MLHEKKIRAAIRKIIRKAKQDHHTLIVVVGSDNESMLENDLINEIMACDETTVRFLSLTTSKTLGSILFVFDYDSDPSEIVCDCTDNAYTHNLLKADAIKLVGLTTKGQVI
jgi:endo-alpha-1,4-polygalactosaminidase (GH114 family)